jgi:hypothetical protein
MKFNDIVLILVIILLVYIVYLQSCGKSSNSVSTNTIKTEYIYDTIVKSYPVLYPKERVVIYSDTQFIPYTDTTYCKELAKIYFAEKQYSDTLNNDSVITYINSKVSQNSLIEQRISYKLKQPTTVITYKTENKVKFYISPLVNFNTQNIYIGGEVMLIDKKDFGYSVSGQYSPVFNDYLIGVSFKYKLKFKK